MRAQLTLHRTELVIEASDDTPRSQDGKESRQSLRPSDHSQKMGPKLKIAKNGLRQRRPAEEGTS